LTRENFLRILEEIFLHQWPVSHLELEAIKFQVDLFLIIQTLTTLDTPDWFKFYVLFIFAI
jgi:hypothetical protein